MSIQLGVNLGPSFADCCLIDTARPTLSLAYRRSYTPNESIAAAVRNFLTQNSQYKPESALVASRVLEKILDTKLGGTVGQVVTRGFENWAYLRQSLQNKFFELQPQRTEALASQDLIFGVTERINAKGEVLVPLATNELEFIVSKLKLMKVERVCVNLIFSDRNSSHLLQVTQVLKAAGFEVFSNPGHECDLKSASQDEILSWRKNLLNASLSGTFKEILTEVVNGCEGILPREKIQVLDGDSFQFVEDNSRIASSLFGPARAISDFYAKSAQVLFLGLEKWTLIKPQVKLNQWMSPWGALAGEVPALQDLRIQPTSALVVDDFGQLNFSADSLGYEPGPIVLGKALKPALFDLLYMQNSSKTASSTNHRMDELLPNIKSNGLLKLRDTLQAMLKSSSVSGQKVELVVEELLNFMVDQIGLHVLLEREDISIPVTCTGIFAPFLLPLLKKRWAEINWDLCPYSLEIEAIAVGGRGTNRGS